jgi:hypothetical protein
VSHFIAGIVEYDVQGCARMQLCQQEHRLTHQTCSTWPHMWSRAILCTLFMFCRFLAAAPRMILYKTRGNCTTTTPCLHRAEHHLSASSLTTLQYMQVQRHETPICKIQGAQCAQRRVSRVDLVLSTDYRKFPFAIQRWIFMPALVPIAAQFAID